MTTSLSDLFKESRSSRLDWNGQEIFSMVEVSEVPDRLIIEFVSASPTPVQGLSVKLARGLLAVNGVEGETLVLWRDTAPAIVEVVVRRRPLGGTPLRLWNVWRTASGVTQAWIGNAAIRVRQDVRNGLVRLECSDGVGVPSFDDLVVKVGAHIEG